MNEMNVFSIYRNGLDRFDMLISRAAARGVKVGLLCSLSLSLSFFLSLSLSLCLVYNMPVSLILFSLSLSLFLSFSHTRTQIYVMIWNEARVVEEIIGSVHTRQHLLSLHPNNIFVIRHPRAFPLYWSHHQKIVVIDHQIAFIGGGREGERGGEREGEGERKREREEERKRGRESEESSSILRAGHLLWQIRHTRTQRER